MSSTDLPMADLDASQAPLLLGISITMMAVAVASVALRFLSRIVTKVPLLLDDWLILAALPFTVATSAITVWGTVYHHLGTHIYATATIDTLHNFLRGLFVFEITYAFSITFSKFSMLAIYWRIFRSDQIKWPLIVTASVTGAWLIASALVAIFTCDPIQGFWEFETMPQCINSQAYFLGSAGSNITIDVIILLIPVTTVMRMKINFSQKVAISAIFGLGIFVTVCSCLRLNQLVKASSDGLTTDPTWDLVGSGVWTDIETTASLMCACLPTMRPLMRLILSGSVHGSPKSRTFGSPRASWRSSMGTKRRSQGRSFEVRDSLARSLDRPVSGIEGSGDWLGKGVGMPKSWRDTVELERGVSPSSPSPLFPVSPPPPAYLSDRSASRISNLPPLPSRSPLRRLHAALAPAGRIPIYLDDGYAHSAASLSHIGSSRHAPSHSWDGAGSAPDPTFTGLQMPSRATSTRGLAPRSAPPDDETPVWGRSRRPSHEPEPQSQLAAFAARQKPLPWTPLQMRTAATDPARSAELAGFGGPEPAEAPLQARTLVRDPATGKYVMSSAAPLAPPPQHVAALAEGRLSDWEAGWEAELDRAAETAWQNSRFASRVASRAASECGSIYEWSTTRSVVGRPAAADVEALPTQRAVAGEEWDRVMEKGGRFRNVTF